MTRIVFTSVIAVFIIACAQVQAQANIDSLMKANKNIKAPSEKLLGVWYSRDSVKSKIEFINERDHVIIQPKWYINNYSFRKENDSVFVSGTAMNWPPFDCILNLIDSNTLEIKFFQYYYTETYNIIFTRDL